LGTACAVATTDYLAIVVGDRVSGCDVGAGFHNELFERQGGVAAGEFAVGGEVSTRIA
jgi:hypothetical protein